MPHPTEQIRFCASRDGTRLAYTTCGHGPAVLWMGTPARHLEFDWGNPVWAPWLEFLTKRRTVVRFDHRGCGLSDREKIEYSLEKLVEDIEAVVAATGHERFGILGHGGSGMASIAFAIRYPERVTHLALLGCPARGRLARAETEAQVEDSELRQKIIEVGWTDETPAFGQFFTALHMPAGLPGEQKAYGEMLRLTTTRANNFGFTRTFLHGDVRELLPRISCPTIVLHARADSIVPFSEGRAIAATIPGPRLVPLESSNHLLVASEPAWQQFTNAVDEFLPGAAENAPNKLMDALTTRELDVLGLVALGLNNSRIAARLKISEKTVRNNVSNVFSKLGVKSRAEAVAVARDNGIGGATTP
jgi:pimeloyl-ACP methyl ester carboxylesterase/DNA-binding CsgD family transcriptional regulator